MRCTVRYKDESVYKQVGPLLFIVFIHINPEIPQESKRIVIESRRVFPDLLHLNLVLQIVLYAYSGSILGGVVHIVEDVAAHVWQFPQI